MNGSCTGTFDAFADAESDDGEGIDVNSFFLPGGILDLDDSGSNDLQLGVGLPPVLELQPSLPPHSQQPLRPTPTNAYVCAEGTAVPSNPWFDTEPMPVVDGPLESESQGCSRAEGCTRSGATYEPSAVASLARPPPGFDAKYTPTQQSAQARELNPSHSTLNKPEDSIEETTPQTTGSESSKVATIPSPQSASIEQSMQDGSVAEIQNHREASAATLPILSAANTCSNDTATKQPLQSRSPCSPVLPTPSQHEPEKRTKQRHRNRKKSSAGMESNILLEATVNGNGYSARSQPLHQAPTTSNKETTSTQTRSSLSNESRLIAHTWITDPMVQLYQWTIEFYCAVLLPTWNRSYLLIRSFLGCIATCIRILLLAGLEILRLAAEEVKGFFYINNILYLRQSPASIAITYISWYTQPTFYDYLMLHYDCPPFIPDILSSLVFYYLCYPCCGPPNKQKIHPKKQTTRRPRYTNDLERWEKYLSVSNLPFLIRLGIPFCCIYSIALGISPQENIFMAHSAARLVDAFGLSVIKWGLVLSPLCWFSGAVQILLWAYLPSGYVCDAAIATIGLATLRTIRTLRETGDA